MMTFLVLLAGAALSVAAGGGAVYVTTEWLPRVDDPAGHGLGTAFSVFGMGLYVVVAAVVYGIVVYRAEPERRLKRALWALLTAPLFILIFGIADTGLNVSPKRELVNALRLFGPMWVVAAVQWVVLRWYIRRGGARTEAQ